MSLLTILWSWAAGVCSALAILQLAIWLQRRTVPAHAWLALAALGASANALAELVQLHAQDGPTYSRALILQHYPIFLVVVALVWFVDASLGDGAPVARPDHHYGLDRDSGHQPALSPSRDHL